MPQKKIPEDSGGEDGIVCVECKSTDGDPSDPIVFCDGCDLIVHATRYGNPLVNAIPEGDWFCYQCYSRRSPSLAVSVLAKVEQ
ncbi:putative chromatin regulator PHD family [Rosa chinensis]|uniref:Putative chromatin regulator PHD family n=1 Tax=Rosa chinensis TaxID=74649 RepID=A0A2P6Q9J6_ROSCH|nr:putative chromatin regulator PHD family [Rosa chinensis]